METAVLAAGHHGRVAEFIAIPPVSRTWRQDC
jgi:hypothetical protein